jgi:hypothetical protein
VAHKKHITPFLGATIPIIILSKIFLFYGLEKLDFCPFISWIFVVPTCQIKNNNTPRHKPLAGKT